MRNNYLLYIIISIFFISPYVFSNDCEKPTMPTELEWNNWIAQIKSEALTKGISQETLDNQFRNLKPQSKIIMRDRCQRESTITLKEYAYYRLDKPRIYTGKLKAYMRALDKIERLETKH